MECTSKVVLVAKILLHMLVYSAGIHKRLNSSGLTSIKWKEIYIYKKIASSNFKVDTMAIYIIVMMWQSLPSCSCFIFKMTWSQWMPARIILIGNSFHIFIRKEKAPVTVQIIFGLRGVCKFRMNAMKIIFVFLIPLPSSWHDSWSLPYKTGHQTVVGSEKPDPHRHHPSICHTINAPRLRRLYRPLPTPIILHPWSARSQPATCLHTSPWQPSPAGGPHLEAKERNRWFVMADNHHQVIVCDSWWIVIEKFY